MEIPSSGYPPLSRYTTTLNVVLGYYGSAIIFNFERFPNEKDFRKGSDKDVSLLKDLLDRAQMKTTIYKNLPKNEMLKQLQKFAKSEDHLRGCMAFIFILSHGDRTSIDASDGESVYLEEEIYPIFYHDNCPYLKGKPKNFVIQSCRGEKEQLGTFKDAKQFYVSRIPLIPNVSDISVVYASIPFYVSYRDVTGTWLIKSYTEELGAINEMDYEDREYKRLLMRVSQSVMKKSTHKGNCKTTIEIYYRGFDSLLYLPELLTIEELNEKQQKERNDQDWFTRSLFGACTVSSSAF